MDAVVLDQFPFQIDFGHLQQRLRIKEGSEHIGELKDLVAQAETVGRPKALYKMVFVEDKGDDYVVAGSVIFTSRVLRVNLASSYRIFAYLATCGTELEVWAASLEDLLHQYWANVMMEMALRSAFSALRDHLVDRWNLARTATMSPGSLDDWPLPQQRPLFTLLGNTETSVGVRLTDSYLMLPIKSVSGIRFPTEESFESCQLCPRPVCPGRRAPYDATLYERKYRLG
ncbi:MAG: vitamin B12 dependent methionine synthase [Anaerolineae bacterium]|nr:vitamin B12 dependent methionine synthase [Anaerolineae bacterium]